MHVRFVEDFSWAQPGFTIDYKAGTSKNVRRICGEEAVAKGTAVAEDTERKEEPEDGSET
ncbi:hypothetical protein [Rhizobium sp. NFR03]|uniref:hypothetical protein n=1 Tax=Rhizobium sp. NFR03 TaxID=1566263 RepID=UPI0008AC3EFE|nr:hypothetical protein [Rhizobium sp. NFR03]SES05569.1 hypothetical protein SAMN03159406_01959 [Rhizobium sp. NFR03]